MHDLIIIGAGPAGLTAGLYAGRFRLNTLILEKAAVGGQIILSHTIENYPGFPGGVNTNDLIDNMRKQVEALGVKIELREINKIDAGSNIKKVFSDGEVLESKALIIATGCQPKKLGVAGEDKFIGRGVSYCGVCDGPLFKDKEIAVVGGGDRAVEEAIFLTRYAKRVHLIHRRSSLRCSKILEEQAHKCGKISFIFDSMVEQINGDRKVSQLKIKNIKNNAVSMLNCEGIFIFIGIIPNTGFIGDALNLDGQGFILTDVNMQTTCDGVFAAGDCRQKNLWQVITACADGAIAASQAKQFLNPYK